MQNGQFSISGTTHDSKLKLGIDLNYVKCMSCVPVLFGYFVFRER